MATPYPIMLIDAGPKNIAEAKKVLTRLSSCIVLFRIKSSDHYTMFLKAGEQSIIFKLENSSAYDQVISILSTFDFAGIKNKLDMMRCIQNVIKAAPTHTSDFDNRGVFSTHYLKSRLLDGMWFDVEKKAQEISTKLRQNHTSEDILEWLGWRIEKDSNEVHRINNTVSIVISENDDLGTKTRDGVAPSYTAVSELKNNTWVILTNGTNWRLYTSKISATTTNYFEINLRLDKKIIFEYLVAIFSTQSYQIHNGKTAVDVAFDEGRTYARELEEDLASKILTADGLFLDLVKGVLDHDKSRKFRTVEMELAKETALKIMYRIWFLLYAESRDLLPVKDEKYRPISLQMLRTKLDSMEKNPDVNTCWASLLKLFEGIRNGSVDNNLPQYNGDLFKTSPSIDGIDIRNRFIIPALRGLFEKDGEPMDYASLGVRYLGNIYETLMEFTVRQADKDIMLLEDKNGVREVATSKDSTYSYKKNDLYLASKGGIASRKSSASYYTPQEIVKFLVNRALEPIFEEREKQVAQDLAKYRKKQDEGGRRVCIDRLLDIQVLDPAMGSGHFLVEALNRITSWATGLLEEYRDHPLIHDIEKDRNTVIKSQKDRGISLDESLLTDDVLLKRRVMKRCIFGVDLNPLAVELAKLSLWLDSFAIGVPLTYMNHHLKMGDSTIGMWRDDLIDKKNQTLDNWTENTSRVGDHMVKVSCSSDVTIDQVQSSEDEHGLYEEQMAPHKMMLDVLAASKIDPGIIPKKIKDMRRYVERFGSITRGESVLDNNLMETREKVQKLSKRYRFFHWELEMMDAFTDSRKGFDVLVGNPPWDTIMPSIDEFFSAYYLNFTSLKPNPQKIKKTNELLKQNEIRLSYEDYKKSFADKSLFYKTTKLQGNGHKDLWQLILERSLNLISDGGIISMVIPSQILANMGSTAIRKILLEKDILSMYVFENKKKIFDIHSSYRFVLLTFRNVVSKDKFPVGFYLHNLSTLEGDDSEKEKFFTLSKNIIQKISSKDFIIPETGEENSKLLLKLTANKTLDEEFDGWTVKTTSCFNATNDSDLFREDGQGWAVLKGGSMHQFIHNYKNPEHTANKLDGLRREGRKRIYLGQHNEIYNSFRLAFRQISSPTNMRTIISTIIPPKTFHTHAMNSIILQKNGNILLNASYDKRIVYLCGILNSMAFDYVARTKVQMNTGSILSSLPIPKKSRFDADITTTSSKLCVGTKEFAGLAESLRIENHALTPNERIDNVARLDAMVAHAYQLTRDEYSTVLNSFKFGEDPTMVDAEHVDWSGSPKTMRNFFGEVRKLALLYYDEVIQ